MNKTLSTTLLVPVLMVAASLTLFTVASADERGQSDSNAKIGVETKVQIGQQIKVENSDKIETEDDNSNSDNRINAEVSGSATSTDSNKDSAENHGKGDEHRSEVADIVHKLQQITGTDRGIGDDVREIAMEQASTSEDAAEHMNKIESENPIKTFLFGFDFKNIGDLRSSFVTTQNHIDRLKTAADKVTDVQVKAELTTQITALEDTASSTQLFISQHEQTFSLFGWLMRMIGR